MDDRRRGQRKRGAQRERERERWGRRETVMTDRQKGQADKQQR